MKEQSRVPETISCWNAVLLRSRRQLVCRSFQSSTFQMLVKIHPQFFCIFKIIPEFLLLFFNPLKFLLHHIMIFLDLLFLVKQSRLLAICVCLFLIQHTQLLQVELDCLSLFIDLVILMSDFLVQNGVIFHILP